MKTIFHNKHIRKYPLLITIINNNQYVVYNNNSGYYYKNHLGTNIYIKFENVHLFSGEVDANNNPIYSGHVIEYETLHEIWNDVNKCYDKYEMSSGVIVYSNFTFKIMSIDNIKNQYDKGYIEGVRQWKDGTHDWESIENIESYNMTITNHIDNNDKL